MLLRAPENHSRSLVKAISWRALGSLDTFVISFFVTGNLVFAGSIASVETVTKVILFYFHERLWALVPWGRADKVVEHDREVTIAHAPPATAPAAQPAVQA
ncbi:MAG TPA: DUF2061 domain-containing protein [Caulobacteraceae bacterium]|nr:DUF2061 domain-containing protein [Caulobacteraceae bacterium]